MELWKEKQLQRRARYLCYVCNSGIHKAKLLLLLLFLRFGKITNLFYLLVHFWTVVGGVGNNGFLTSTVSG